MYNILSMQVLHAKGHIHSNQKPFARAKISPINLYCVISAPPFSMIYLPTPLRPKHLENESVVSLSLDNMLGIDILHARKPCFLCEKWLGVVEVGGPVLEEYDSRNVDHNGAGIIG